jgi:CubicO group peptidase (beta-lactamase class C family)
MKLSRGSVAAVLVLLVAGPAGVAGYKLRQQLVTGTGVAATQLCALEFVAGLDRKRARELYIDPLIREAASILRVETDTDRQAVTASVPGIVRQVAFHRPGYGCTLERDGSAPLQALPDARSISLGMALDRAHRDAVFDVAKLEAAVDGAFRQDPERPLLNTLAVVVLHDGKLVAERYAEGVAPDTRLPGWSMAKSVTATLVGVLVERGVVDVHAPGAISEWRDTDDPRSEISLDHLLRMTSGLLITESADRGDGLDPNSRMLYHEADAARFAATRELHWDVGTHFEYMSGNFILAMRAAQEAIGGDLRQAHAFIHEHLFEPLKMQGAVFEPDQAGTFLGSSHLFASARDWARFGQLYVDGGMAGDRRLIPEDWVDYVTTPTRPSTHSRRGDVFWEPGRSAYGAGFWLFADDTREAGEVSAALPGDAFDANGFQGQYTHIIPSEKLVVVRLGATNFRGPDYERLPLEVLAAKLECGAEAHPLSLARRSCASVRDASQ